MSVSFNGSTLSDDPLWYKDAIIYQTHVKAFYDSAGDGIGDFRGLTEKLSYLEELGVNAVWLLPFYPSPLKDDGYDIADYTDVHNRYGTIQDFTRFLNEAHRRGIRVITELVINHTSDQHPWFQRARRARPGSRERDFYVWSETPEKYRGTRIIFKDFEPSNWSMDPVAKAYYWHRFYSHQPDLNFDNPEVRRAVFQALDFWMRRGVDALRLDAVPYLFEREGTSCENLPETHAFLKQLRQYVDQRYRNRMLLAEANQWPEDAAAYFGNGDECHMNFHFPIMPRMFMALKMEDRYPIVDIMQQTPAIPENCQWAVFLRNHDELTLEMVTDRERDYMYQAYAREPEMRINLGIRRRLAPLLNNDRRAIELMNGLLFSLPGSPILYYGDEIGMGDNVYLGDRNGVRTPMQWSADRNAGFSRANPQRLYLPVIIDPQYHYESVNVEAQENNPQSLLWWMRRLIGLRKRFAAFGRGSLEFLASTNYKVLSFLREHRDERVLVVANLSRFAQQVDLDLERFRGMVPVEAFGQTRFRPIGEQPYSLTLGPYAFYWFSLEPQRVEFLPTQAPSARLQLAVSGNWENALEGRARMALERALPEYLKRMVWFPGRLRQIDSVRILDVVRVVHRKETACVLLLQVEYGEGILETHALPVTFAAGERARTIEERSPQAGIAEVKVAGKEAGLLYDALWDPASAALLLHAIAGRRKYSGREFELVGSSGPALERILASHMVEPPATADASENGAQQAAARSANRRELVRLLTDRTETKVLRPPERRGSIVFGGALILKLYRHLEAAINPDLEMGRFLTDHGFVHVPATAGALEIRRAGREPMTLAVLREFVPHEQTAWQYTLDALGRFFEQALAHAAQSAQVPLPSADLVSSAAEEIPLPVREVLGFYLAQAGLVGQRTAEFHAVLASDPDVPAFAPEPFTPFYQRSQMQSLRNLRVRVLQGLRERLDQFPQEVQGEARAVLDAEAEIRDRFRLMHDRVFQSLRIRCHDNYHLRQLLYTGKDFVITDFEGAPGLSLSERRGKHSAIRDVASMIRSFHRAAYETMLAEAQGALPAGLAQLEPWHRFWQAWVPVAFLRGYLETAGGAPFVPAGPEELRVLLNIAVLEGSLYEIGLLLRQGSDDLRVPLHAIGQWLRPAVQPVQV